MNKIKFSHEYLKLPKALPFEAHLMQILKVNYNDLSEDFIMYDTEKVGGGKYELPKTELILLILMTGDSENEPTVFTTLRRYTPTKWEYYKTLVGKTLEMIKV